MNTIMERNVRVTTTSMIQIHQEQVLVCCSSRSLSTLSFFVFESANFILVSSVCEKIDQYLKSLISSTYLSNFSLIFKLLWKSQVIFFPKHYSFYTLLSSCTILPESLTLSLRLRVRFNICSVSFSCIPLWCLMIVSASSPSPTLRCRNCDSKISNNHMHQSSSFYIDFF